MGPVVTGGGLRRVRLRSVVPTALTIARPFLAITALAWCRRRPVASLGAFGVAALTDTLDGSLARRFDSVSDLGSRLDPLADRILVGSLLVSSHRQRAIPKWLIAGIVGREVLLVGVVGSARLAGRPRPGVNRAGKLTTAAVFSGAIAALLARLVRSRLIGGVANAVLAGAMTAGLASVWQYWKQLYGTSRD